MIEQARSKNPNVSVGSLCRMSGVNRSWYLNQYLSRASSSLEEESPLRVLVLNGWWALSSPDKETSCYGTTGL